MKMVQTYKCNYDLEAEKLQHDQALYIIMDGQ